MGYLTRGRRKREPGNGMRIRPRRARSAGRRADLRPLRPDALLATRASSLSSLRPVRRAAGRTAERDSAVDSNEVMQMSERNTIDLAVHLSKLLTDAQNVIAILQQLNGPVSSRTLLQHAAYQRLAADVAAANAWLTKLAVTREVISASSILPAEVRLEELFPTNLAGRVIVKGAAS
jgi:hypothetical protein